MTHTEYMRKWRAENPDRNKAIKAKWDKAHPEMIRKWKLDSYHRTYSKNRAKVIKRSSDYKKAHPGMAKAHNAINNEIRAGRLTRQPCVECGNPKSHAHHQDYSKPLDVMWLCCVHHKAKHMEG